MPILFTVYIVHRFSRIELYQKVKSLVHAILGVRAAVYLIHSPADSQDRSPMTVSTRTGLT